MKEPEFYEEEEPFHLRMYRKQELAMMYFPDLSKESAGKNLRRWIHKCTELCREQEALGYDKNRKFYLKREVRLIVEYLGEP